ncbi:T9SS type A sorting domain-containing protein [Yeosuana sp. MJ-SS3]|uniref:T9SS type A sorting domain-containing protein n=1 Tax=Gilvirhabdus luticola TaxID=3079858 RepID=A0ABU3U4X5_9FLAO|nr:T9SS type A sorting domain-containing protein [Yeosuana sp. MJ-SS3]MDU8885359.1 T9SS type A sorting domain-containing protein [Yeosuana sp. MJ-SS3]
MVMFFLGYVAHSQIYFTFANAQNTNDGSFDYYEVDVMIHKPGKPEIELGSGELFFLYNTAAFGNSINANGAFEVTHPYPGYICGEYSGNFYNYTGFTTNDDTDFRVSWKFSPVGVAFAPNVNGTPAKLCHVKVKYVDVGQDPMFRFEKGNAYDDRFYTDCPNNGGWNDCNLGYPIHLTPDYFDSSGSTLSNKDFETLTGLSIYPNPTTGILNVKGDVSKLRIVEMYSVIGKLVMGAKDNFRVIDISSLHAGIYFLKFNTEDAIGTVKIIKK